jgi:uncharacterized protein YeaO (DUF488 family)
MLFFPSTEKAIAKELADVSKLLHGKTRITPTHAAKPRTAQETREALQRSKALVQAIKGKTMTHDAITRTHNEELARAERMERLLDHARASEHYELAMLSSTSEAQRKALAKRCLAAGRDAKKHHDLGSALALFMIGKNALEKK